jgi:hypothetical protein
MKQERPNNTFWKADKATSKKIEEAFKLRKVFTSACSRLARRFKGADRQWFYTSGGGFSGRDRLAGFRFKNETDVNQKLFCRLKNTTDGWKPRAGPNKESKELWKEFNDITDETMPTIMDLLGLAGFYGFGCTSPGVCVIKGYAYIEVSGNERKKPKGCKRISDLTYENAVKPITRRRHVA